MCMPDSTCPCCVCNGKFCLMWHPGHNHATNTAIEEFFLEDNTPQPTPGPLPEHDDMA